jgi:hypothetical protein
MKRERDGELRERVLVWVCVGEKGKKGLRKLEKNNVNQVEGLV